MALADATSLAYLIGYVIAALAACWIFRDAKRRGVRGAVVWGIFTFLFLIIALPLYLLWGRKRVKPSQPVSATTRRFCVECGKESPPDVRFCTNCGKELLS